MNDVKHGTQGAYNKHACRCKPCRAWKSAKNHADRARWKAAAPGSPPPDLRRKPRVEDVDDEQPKRADKLWLAPCAGGCGKTTWSMFCDECRLNAVIGRENRETPEVERALRMGAAAVAEYA